MKRTLPIAVMLGLVASLFTAVPALGWHVTTYECEEPGTSGGVRVPDADWASGGLDVYIEGTQTFVGHVGQGQTLDLPSGKYRGDWNTFTISSEDGEEPEFFKVLKDCPPLPPPPEKPKPPTVVPPTSKTVIIPRLYDPKARFIGPCADPHLKFVLDNHASNVPVKYKVVFKRGKDNTRKVVFKWTKPGQVKTSKWRWMRRGKAVIRGHNHELLAKVFVRRGAAWGTAGCIK